MSTQDNAVLNKTEWKERPILFTGAMVRAILAGRKTQTRRLNGLDHYNIEPDAWSVSPTEIRSDALWRFVPKSGPRSPGIVRCPYGAPGDRLWVRETWCLLDHDHWEDKSLPRDWLSSRYTHPRRNACAYRSHTDSDGERIRLEYVRVGRDYRWRPSIHMPRWASRLLLEVTAVRVERLKDISVADAEAEGIDWTTIGMHPGVDIDIDGQLWPAGERKIVDAYRNLWESINGPGAWDANPWVWVVGFKRVAP